jgi:transcriptional/translational regulatory protein YebC/TACO1
VAAALEARFGPASNTKIAWRSKLQVLVTGEAVATLMKLLDALNDDVQAVYSNEEISEEDVAKLGDFDPVQNRSSLNP